MDPRGLFRNRVHKEHIASRSSLRSYKILKEVHSSPLQILYKARRVVDRVVCIIKRIDLSTLNEEEKYLSFNEVHVLASLKSKYIVKCYDAFIEGNNLYVVVEFTQNSSLRKKIANQKGKLFGERTVWRYFLQIASAVLHMNQNYILHGSLQLQSIFLNSHGDVRLSGFGRAIRLAQGKASGGNRHAIIKAGQYSNKSEMWALGCVLYELCTLRRSFDHRLHTHNSSLSYDDLEPISIHYSAELISLASDLLSSEPKNRPSIQEIWTSSFIRNKAINANVEIPRVFCPTLQVLEDMKHKYEVDGRRHWSRQTVDARPSENGGAPSRGGVFGRQDAPKPVSRLRISDQEHERAGAPEGGRGGGLHSSGPDEVEVLDSFCAQFPMREKGRGGLAHHRGGESGMGIGGGAGRGGPADRRRANVASKLKRFGNLPSGMGGGRHATLADKTNGGKLGSMAFLRRKNGIKSIKLHKQGERPPKYDNAPGLDMGHKELSLGSPARLGPAGKPQAGNEVKSKAEKYEQRMNFLMLGPISPWVDESKPGFVEDVGLNEFMRIHAL